VSSKYPQSWSGIALLVAVFAVSLSGPLIAFAAAPALAIAFWRNAMAVGVITPVALVRRRGELRELVTSRYGVVCALAGCALAGHFATWVPSIKLTTIATATALVATQPVWQALLAVGTGRRLAPLAWAGIGIAVAGAALTTGIDASVRASALMGDVLAVLGAMCAAVYTALGESARQRTSTTSYTAICYGVCAALLLIACLSAGLPLGGYAATTWLALLALTAGPQLLGHSLFNFAVRRVPATTVAVLMLLEVPGAAAIGWAWLGQVPPVGVVPGLLLLLLGVALVLGRSEAGFP
jgi:drug/metabolite transporter (DMT)-like permease